MTTPTSRIERQIQRSGVIIIVGLAVELFSLTWSHPTAFLVFLLLGGLLTGGGILLYLYSLTMKAEAG